MSASISADEARSQAQPARKVIPFPRNARTHAVTSPRLAVVVAYANPDGTSETRVEERDDTSMVGALRQQILSLAEHYARDVTRLTDREQSLCQQVSTLTAKKAELTQQLQRSQKRTQQASHEADLARKRTLTAVEEANELSRQVIEMAECVSALREDLMRSQQRARLFEEAALCGLLEFSAKRKLIEAARKIPME